MMVLRPERYFFEIPIYRTGYEQFIKQYDDAFQQYVEQFDQLSGIPHDIVPKTTRLHVEQHFWETYGGPWRYNQVIGWMRLYVLGSQVRGELWLMTGKRFHRKSRNQIRLIGKTLEMSFERSESSEEILARIEERLQRLEKEWRRRRRVLDLECFRSLAPYMDWRALLDN